MAMIPMQNVDASAVLDEQAIDVETLAALIRTCFAAAKDGRYSRAQRGLLTSTGTQLRDQMVLLIKEVFEKNSAELIAANDAIKKVNAELKAALVEINRMADAIEAVGDLVEQITDLIGIVSGL